MSNLEDEHRDPELKKARTRLERSGAKVDSPEDILKLLSPETEKRVLLAALELLPYSASGDSIEQLKILSFHPDPDVRKASFTPAAVFLKERGTDFYVECLKHPNFREKSDATYRIWRYGTSAAVPAMTKRLGQILKTRKGRVYCFHNGASELTQCLEFLHPYREEKSVARYFEQMVEKWSMLDEREVWWITDQLEYFQQPALRKPDLPVPSIERLLDSDHPIFDSAARRDIEATRRYLANGASVYSSDTNRSLAKIAIENNDLDLVRLLVEFGWDVERPVHGFRDFPLIVALRAKSDGVVDYILDRRINLDRREEYGLSLFVLACCGIATAEQIKRMIGMGADIHESRFRGKTPFFFSAEAEAIPVMEVLADEGANIDAVDDDGSTPLIRCAGGGKLQSVQWLLDHKADPFRRNRYGKDALSRATENGHTDIIALLQRRGDSGNGGEAGFQCQPSPPINPSHSENAKSLEVTTPVRQQPSQKKRWWKLW
jgi:ankyrin repeat protein